MGRLPRHAQLNDLIHRSLLKSGFPASKEPVGLLRNDGKRPDGCTFTAWVSGKNLAWDVTVSDTLAPSHVAFTSLTAGAAAERATIAKNLKYSDICRSHFFCAVALETLGPINADGHTLLSKIGRRLSELSGDTRESAFFYQRVSIIVQRSNAASFSGSFFIFIFI